MARAHGTYGRYKRDGCRCEACRMAFARAKGAKRAVWSKTRGDHGTLACYQTGCRCAECKTAFTDWRAAAEADFKRSRRWF
jgi:hypothetical protein